MTGNGCTLSPDIGETGITIDLTLPPGDNPRKITEYLDEHSLRTPS